MQQISAVIQNYDKASSFSAQFIIFDENGGDIGSLDTTKFSCNDMSDSIAPKHAHVGFEEGVFTICGYKDCEIFYSDSYSKLPDDYESVINLGDIFRIGELKFIFIDPSRIDEYIGKAHKIIENTKNFDKLDDKRFEPVGKISNVDFKEEPKINSLINDKKDITLNENVHDAVLNLNEIAQNFDEEENANNQNMLTAKSMDELLTKIVESIKLQPNMSPISEQTRTLNTKDMETIMKTLPLSDSTELINTVLVKLICKELYSQMYDIVENNSFFKYLSGAVLKSTKEDKEAFNYLLHKALQSYMLKK
ncbi:hypothetical protein [Campylobacter concisus]|uniref:hypothetical protein n=1 Tax=Campylobacter concisus TaxID=199 RepID=UPI000D309DAE|nr:hypothetical protein [Campylobacter concisus]